MNAKDTAERIRNLRKARGMSQSQFAAMCGIEQGQLCNYECGRIMPTIPLCERICESVGLRVVDFLSEDKAPKGPIPTEQRIGERVKAWRQMRGLNQEALAERAGIADSTISCIERGGRYGAVSTYLYIAEALNVPHVPAPRGARTGTQGLKNSREKAIIPPALCDHIVDICEEA